MDESMEFDENVEYMDDVEPSSEVHSTQVHSTQSQSIITPLDRVKTSDLRTTKSSPNRNVKLHHTRSFSEICHLHPSRTNVSCFNDICPKPRAIEELKHEVRRPESVLEISELPTTSDEDSDEESIAVQQQKGDEAMKIFLESNINVPLDGNMTSSSISQDTIESDIASESELILGNWERGTRDSLQSTGSSLDKRFLTPSGLLLYREQQADCMLDTKRLKITPSSSERPMSPLALRTGDGAKKDSSGDEDGYKEDNESDDDVDDMYPKKEFVLSEDSPGKDCDGDLGLQDLRQLIRKYEIQCEQLINRSKEQHDEIKRLRKDNVNMHKEHNRLQVLIRQFYENEDTLKGNMTTISETKDKKISELGRTVRDLGSNLHEKNCEISQLKTNVETFQRRGEKYVEIMKDVMDEVAALFQAVAKELGLDETFEFDVEKNPEELVYLLKTRRQSLSDELKSFYGNLHELVDHEAMNKIKSRMEHDFQELSSGYHDTITKIQRAEETFGCTVKHSASSETLLKQSEERNEIGSALPVGDYKSDFDMKLDDLQRKNGDLVKQNQTLQDDCANEWRLGSSEMSRRSERILPSVELGRLKKILQARRKFYSEASLDTLQQTPLRFNLGDEVLSEEQEENIEVIFETEFSSTSDETAILPEKGKLEVKKEENGTGRSFVSPSQNEELCELEMRLKQLSMITQNLNDTIEKSSVTFGELSQRKQDSIDRSSRLLSDIYGAKLFSMMKGLYDEHLRTLQDTIESRDEECRYTREQLLSKENNIEEAVFCIESLTRDLNYCRQELRNYESKNKDLKRELKAVKDRVLMTKAEREMSLFYRELSDGKNSKHKEVESGEDTALFERYGVVEERRYFKKQIKYSGT